MTAAVTRNLVFLQSGTCLAEECFTSFYHSLQLTQAIRGAMFDSLVQFAWHPRTGVSLRTEDQSYLREKQMLDHHGRVSVTAVEILKACYNPETYEWHTEGLRVETGPALKIDLPRSPPKKLVAEPKAADVLKPIEPPPLALLPVPQPSNNEILDLVRKIKGNNDVLQDLIAKGGMSWKLETSIICYDFQKGTLGELLCEKALLEDDLELLETVLPFLSSETVTSRIESIFHTRPDSLLETPVGNRMLRAHKNLRQFLLNELLPGDPFRRRPKFQKIEFLKEVLSPIEFACVVRRKISLTLLNELILLRINIPDYKRWCLKYLEWSGLIRRKPEEKRSDLEKEVLKKLKLEEIMDEVLKGPPSVDRSQMALDVTVRSGFVHPSLKDFPFRFKEPEDSNNYRLSIDSYLLRFLEVRSISHDFESIKLVIENFGFLCGNKKGIQYFDRYFNPDQIREERRLFNEMIDSFEVYDEPPQRPRFTFGGNRQQLRNRAVNGSHRS